MKIETEINPAVALSIITNLTDNLNNPDLVLKEHGTTALQGTPAGIDVCINATCYLVSKSNIGNQTENKNKNLKLYLFLKYLC